MRRFLREQSLTLFFLAIFVAALIGQAFAGHEAFNQDQLEHGERATSFWSYTFSSHFGNALLENWQSEYLQFLLYAVATVWLIQRGSPESKPPDKQGLGSDREHKIGKWADPDSPAWAKARGIRTAIYSHSLLIVMLIIFIGSWFGQSVTGWTDFNADQQAHHEPGVSWLSYIGSAHFWEATLQNWQSEFLAIGSFAAITIFLRQRGSPESKPVGAPHGATGTEV